MKNKIPFELRITLIYIIIGAAWILFSDKLLYAITKDPLQINIFSILKGWFYVMITGLLLFFLVKKEISKRNKLYNELLTANKKAKESERLRTAFLSNLSHYIRTPMNSILGFAELIHNRNISDAKRNQFLTLINEKSHHLLQTINNIVEISKIQEGQIEVERNTFQMGALINRLSLIFEQDLQRKGNKVRLNFKISPEITTDEIIADYNKIYHILSNLLSNSVNFTESGEIELGALYENGNLKFYIRDTGPGISEDMQKSLFANFMQGHPDIQRASEGSGLGLYLSANLAKLLGGNLWLEYSNDTGSMFCFSLPFHNNSL